jgi:hypothetical protein
MPEYPVASLPLENIRLDGGTQTRAGLLEETIEEYTDRLKKDPDCHWDTPVVVFDDGTEYWLADGFHRHQAYSRAGLETMPCEIHLGEQRDALAYALSANASHGLRRSNADKRRAVELALADPEWSQWTDGQIAKLCAVSSAFVGKIRPLTINVYSDTEQTASQNSQPETPATEQPVAEEQPAPAQKRKYKTRSGKTTTMRTERIGRKKKASAATADDEAPTSESPPTAAPSRNGSVTDAVGLPVPESLLRVFQERKLFAELHRLRKELADRLDHLAKSPGGLHLLWKLSHRQTQGQSSYRWRPLDQLKALLRDSEPCCCLCPSCHLKHPGIVAPECEQCYGHGWIPHGTWKQIPDEDRQEVEALVPASE